MITLTITGETMKEILAKLSDYTPSAKAAPQPVNPTPVPTLINTSPAIPLMPTPAAASAPATVVPPVRMPNAIPTNAYVPAPTTAPTYTYEQIGKAGADLVAANPTLMTPLMMMLQRYGVQLITDLKPDQLGPFAVELRGMGARI